jgi:chromosome partitioning protein
VTDGTRQEALHDAHVLEPDGTPHRRHTVMPSCLHTGLPPSLQNGMMAPMLVVAFCGQKGGVGKSTAAIHVASEWLERGKRVLLIDADPQATAVTWFNVAMESGTRRTPTVVAMGNNMHRDGQFQSVAANFDRVVIDCPARIDAIQRSALLVSNLAILPCGPSGTDTWALTSSIELVQQAQDYRPQLRGGVLITRKQAATAMGRAAREALAESPLPVLRTELGLRVAFSEAITGGYGVTSYAPRDEAAEEIRSLVDELDDLTAHRKGTRDGKEKAASRPSQTRARGGLGRRSGR